MAHLVTTAGGHAGGEDRQVHAVQAVRDLVQERPFHPLRRRGKRPALRKRAGHWLGGPSWGRAAAASRSQGPHVSLARSHSGQSHKTWTSSSCAAPQWGHMELVRMPWPDTRAAVLKALAMRQRSNDFSSSVEATRVAARQAGPSAPPPRPPKVTGRRASSWREEWQQRLSRTWCWIWRRGTCTKCRGDSYPGTSQHHQPSRGLQPRVAAVWSTRPTGPHRVSPGWAAARFPDGLHEDLGDPRLPGRPSQPKQTLVPGMHHRGDAVTLG